eukprot:1200345-Ditylum_brightwellii.AAC.1
MATEGLATKFDCKEGSLYLFVEEVEHATYSVLTDYARLSMDDIAKHARFKFLSHNRCHQNNTQFYYYLLNSIDKSSKIQILQEDRQLHVQGIPIGLSLFKLLILETVADAVNNISGFKSRGEKSDDLIVNLFHGYLVATDYKFTQHIERQQERYEKGETMEYTILMKLTLNKYTVLKGKLEWGALSKDRQEIVALLANVQKLKDQNIQLKNNSQKKPAAPKSNKSNPSNNNNNRKRTKPKKQDLWAWKKIPPKDIKAHQKQVKHPKSGISEMYCWCPAHTAWTKHNPDPNHPDKGQAAATG